MQVSIKKIAIVLGTCTLLSACGGKTEPHYNLEYSDYFSQETYKSQYKVGNPYKVQGVTYYPKEDPSYSEVGMASWYGPKFHGKSTANGDRFNQDALTAAHKTLPLPSMVRVTNLQNGRTLMVMVNDRGPFSRGRVIDVSRRAAQLLGFEQQGVAKVKVEYLKGHSDRLLQQLALVRPSNTASQPSSILANVPSPVQQTQTSSYVPAPTSSPTYVTKEPVGSNGIFVQVGAYQERTNAVKAQSSLSNFETAHIVPIGTGNDTLYRVWVGPFATRLDADITARRMKDSGHDGVMVVSH